MSCCGGRSCGYDIPKVPVSSRYPIPAAQLESKNNKSLWKQAENASPQFDAYPLNFDQKGSTDDLPYTFVGDNLAAVDFPLGGFGCGNVCLHGDGTLQRWTMVNKTLPEGNADVMPANFFGISAN